MKKLLIIKGDTNDADYITAETEIKDDEYGRDVMEVLPRVIAAIKEAKKSAKKGEYAIGAVVVRNGKIIAKSQQRRFRDKTPAAHAECLAISKACKKRKSIFIEGSIIDRASKFLSLSN